MLLSFFNLFLFFAFVFRCRQKQICLGPCSFPSFSSVELKQLLTLLLAFSCSWTFWLYASEPFTLPKVDGTGLLVDLPRFPRVCSTWWRTAQLTIRCKRSCLGAAGSWDGGSEWEAVT